VEKAASTGKYLKAHLEALMAKHRIVKEVRGLGLMLGMELRFDVYNVIQRCAQNGVLILDAGRNVLRFLPPLVITDAQIEKATAVLDKALEEEENARSNPSGPVAH
jgi:acetylornithine/LysW-gamma-L-lysine aminotransferase